MAPYDVLVDPASIPKHPVFDDLNDDDDDENQVRYFFGHFK